MSHGPEAPSSQGRPAESNVLPMGHAEVLPVEVGRFGIEARLAGFVAGGGMEGCEQWFQSFLNQLRPGESLSLRIALDTKTGLSLGAAASAPRTTLAARTRQLEGLLAVGRDDHVEAGAPQVVAGDLRNLALVLDHEDRLHQLFI